MRVFFASFIAAHYLFQGNLADLTSLTSLESELAAYNQARLEMIAAATNVRVFSAVLFGGCSYFM
jgi:hypothetical protein